MSRTDFFEQDMRREARGPRERHRRTVWIAIAVVAWFFIACWIGGNRTEQVVGQGTLSTAALEIDGR